MRNRRDCLDWNDPGGVGRGDDELKEVVGGGSFRASRAILTEMRGHWRFWCGLIS